MGNWLECVRSRKATNAPIEVGYQHSICTILGYQALDIRQEDEVYAGPATHS